MYDHRIKERFYFIETIIPGDISMKQFSLILIALAISAVLPSITARAASKTIHAAEYVADDPLPTCITLADGTCGSAIKTDRYFSAKTVKNTAAAVPVDVWNYCRYIDNIDPINSLFVPFRTANEWVHFRDNHPPLMISLVHCARPTTAFAIPPSSACPSASPASVPVSLPYDRTGAIRTFTASFSCDSAAGSWVQSARARYRALDADVADPNPITSPQPSWKLLDIIYDGTPPALVPPGNVPVHTICTIAAYYNQTLKFSLSDGTSQTYPFIASEGGVTVLDLTFASAPVAIDVYATAPGEPPTTNGSPSAKRIVNLGANSMLMTTEDGIDADYNDLNCTFTW
jgi:hypothetical protein